MLARGVARTAGAVEFEADGNSWVTSPAMLAQVLCGGMSVESFVPTACFSAPVRHRAAHYKRLAPAAGFAGAVEVRKETARDLRSFLPHLNLYSTC
ncbi:hypothetical protein [Sphingobacterium lactis]|uniref:hypothetical protein n=1 Tax=Sphingobacterium lactis TaxID=797291 RepID=UPI003DA53434